MEWIASELGADIIPDSLAGDGILKTGCGYSLVPGLVEGEGQYCAALRKTSRSEYVSEKAFKGSAMQKVLFLPEGTDDMFSVRMKFAMKGDMLTAVPEIIAGDVAILRQCLHVISAGCAVGLMKGKILVPDADMALSIKLAEKAYPRAQVDRKTALAYLHRDSIILPDAPKGYVLVCHDGLPLGFVKNLGNRCNSLHPQSRRIRMSIH